MFVRFTGLIAFLLVLHSAVRLVRPTGPVGLLLEAGRNATLVPPGQETSGARAQPGALLFYGSRILTGGEPISFVYYPDQAIYTFTPRYSALPLRNLDPTKPNTEYEVRFDLKGVVRQNMDPVIDRALPRPLLLPDAQRLGRRDISPAEAGVLLPRIEAALESATRPRDQALLRLSRAAALEAVNQLPEALREYQRLAAVWNEASWIRNKKVPLLDRQIRTDQLKATLSQRPGRTFALLVAISDYQFTPSPLPVNQIAKAEFAERDVDSLRALLESARGGLRSDSIVALTGPAATVSTVRNKLRNMLEHDAGPQDTVLIFLSGQGWTDTIGETSKAFFMAYDSNPQDKATTAYPLDELGEIVRGNLARVRRVYMIADLCRVASVASTPNTVNSLLRSQFEGIQGEAEILLSTSADPAPVQVSQVDSQLEGGHGIFSYYLVKGLQGAANYNSDGRVTPDEIYRYVSEQVALATNDKQRPVHFGRIAPDTPLATLTASASPPLRRAAPVLLASARLPGLLAFVPAAAPQLPATPQLAPPPSTDPTVLEDEGQQILLQYLSGEETPPTRQDFERGADRFRRAYAQDPSPEILARQLFFEGRLKAFQKDPASVVDLRSAMDLDPTGAYAYNGLGIALLQRAEYRDAAGAFRDATVRAPHWVYPRHNLGLTYAEAGAYDGAEREYREAIRMEPRYSYVHYSLANLLHRLGRKKEAQQEYRDAIRLNPAHPEPYIGLGALLASMGRRQRQEAETNYATAIRLNSGLPSGAHNLGLLYATDNRTDDAIKTWLENLRINPAFVPSRMSLAAAYSQKQQFDAAIGQYRAVLASFPDYPAANLALHETLGDRHRQQKQVSEATAEYQAALRFAIDATDKKRIGKKLRKK